MIGFDRYRAFIPMPMTVTDISVVLVNYPVDSRVQEGVGEQQVPGGEGGNLSKGGDNVALTEEQHDLGGGKRVVDPALGDDEVALKLF